MLPLQDRIKQAQKEHLRLEHEHKEELQAVAQAAAKELQLYKEQKIKELEKISSKLHSVLDKKNWYVLALFVAQSPSCARHLCMSTWSNVKCCVQDYLSHARCSGCRKCAAQSVPG
jgi:hypothetical protein